MILNKALPAAAAVVLGLALALVDDARHGADNGHPAVGARKSAAKTSAQTTALARPQNSSGQAPTAPNADRFMPRSRQAPGVVNSQHSGYRPAAYGSPYGATDGSAYGTMSASVYGSLNGSEVGSPLIYWAPGRWYPYPGFGDKRSFIPPPEGVWGR
jgi:hypothetical protein